MAKEPSDDKWTPKNTGEFVAWCVIVFAVAIAFLKGCVFG